MSQRIVVAACAVVLLTAGALAKPGLSTTNVNLRAASNTTSEVLAKIPAGAPLDVGDCTDGWCAVTYMDKSGFAIATALDTSGRPRPRPVRRAPRVVGPDDYVPATRVYPMYPAAPGYYYGPRPYYGWGAYLGPRWVGGWGYGWRRW